jgi:hypothetical protein
MSERTVETLLKAKNRESAAVRRERIPATGTLASIHPNASERFLVKQSVRTSWTRLWHFVGVRTQDEPANQEASPVHV